MNPTSVLPGLQPQPAETAANSGDRVSELIQKLVAAATAEVESAAQRTRAQAQVEITQLQQTIDRLRDDLQTERDRLKSIAEQLAGARANAARLEEQLESERSEKARFAATLETVRVVVSGMDAELHGVEPNPAATADVAEADDELIEDEIDLDDVADLQNSAGHLAQLLAQLEEIYRSDLKSAEGTSEVVARLAANLAYARDAYTRRLDSTGAGDTALFDRQLAALVTERADTPFGRHLAMALRGSSPDPGSK